MKTRITLLASAILGVLTALGQGFTVMPSLADLNVARYGHATVNLNDGRILVIGGHTTGFALTSTAEIYNPATDTWTLYNVPNPHDMVSFARMNNGNYIFMGGCDNGYGVGQSVVTTIFDPVNTTFTSGPNMNVARTNSAAARLANGDILVFGNWYNTGNAELYNGTTAQFVTIGAPTLERSYPLVLPTADGNAYILGGHGIYGGTPLNSVEEYNATNQSFTQVSAEIFDGENGWYTAWSAMYSDIEKMRLSDGRYIFLVYRALSGGETEYALATFNPVTKVFAKVLTSPTLPIYNPNASESWAFWGNIMVDPISNYVYLNATSNQGIGYGEQLYSVDVNRGLLYIPTGTAGVSHYICSGSKAWINGNIMYTGGTVDGSNFTVTNEVTVLSPQNSFRTEEFADINAPFFAYPNPVLGTEFYVNLPDFGHAVLEMYNSTGYLVRKIAVPKGITVVTIQRKGLYAGMYYLRLINNTGAMNTRVVLQ